MASLDNRYQSEIAAAADLAREGRADEAIAVLLSVVGETPGPAVCLGLARCYESQGDRRLALKWALAVVDAAADFTSWQAAAALARRNADAGEEPRRRARTALLGSYTTSQFASMLWLAALRVGVSLELYESPYGQYRQEILDPASSMYRFSPDLVVLAVMPASSPCPRTAGRRRTTLPRRSSDGSRSGERSAAGHRRPSSSTSSRFPPTRRSVT